MENNTENTNPITEYVSSHTHEVKGQEDLLDIRVGNPLERITKLLEEIKKQKAFSFSLKGSVGLAGVALAASVFGVFGGGKMLCEKGIQTHAGVLEKLAYQEAEPYNIPFISMYLENIAPKNPRSRLILLDGNHAISISPAGNITVKEFIGQKVFITGRFNSCKQNLTLSDQSALEINQ